ncbi:hypothetical protein [Dyadobacter fermentans]|uniref:Secreted protein n=1 Tax=Dyadobacter fermentans (strain ATCC 700827 / DSM 18053 / CIP 107007 / KCTC 52180 / NS114) TaxID=471854 RepID=C6VV36_DYAFD|nr:hypothetical protein [Dyadobacter fermentans]ACT94859.1 hypothetical protein Dfer_3654 [Dyadobacter fermentans DSM 18053]
MLGKILCIIGLSAGLPLGCLAQVSEATKQSIVTGKGLNVPRSGVFWTTPTENSGVVGDFYIDSLWRKGHVKLMKPVAQVGGLESDSIAGIDIRYNVLNDELELLADVAKKDIRVIRGSQLKSFKSNGDLGTVEYINLADHDPKGELKGFGAVLASGKLTLVKAFKTKITKPNYNPGFGTGEKNTIVRISSDYYLLTPSGAEKVSLSKKSFLPLMSDKKVAVEQYTKERNLDFKDETQVAALVQFYNSK